MILSKNRFALFGIMHQPAFKRVYELQIKPSEIFCVPRRQRRAISNADGSDHGAARFPCVARSCDVGRKSFCSDERRWAKNNNTPDQNSVSIASNSEINAALRLPSGLPSERLRLRRLGELLDHHLAFQARDIVDEQHAVQVVDLVLQASRKQAVGFDDLFFAIAVEMLNGDTGRTLDFGIVIRNGEATLFINRTLVR